MPEHPVVWREERADWMWRRDDIRWTRLTTTNVTMASSKAKRMEYLSRKQLPCLISMLLQLHMIVVSSIKWIREVWITGAEIILQYWHFLKQSWYESEKISGSMSLNDTLTQRYASKSMKKVDIGHNINCLSRPIVEPIRIEVLATGASNDSCFR